jgi:DNA-binding NtrC family response regulator
MTPERPPRILLVDDVPANLSVLAAALEPEGYEILVADSGPSAIAVAGRALPDLILLDIVMPGPDGLETCRRLQQDPAMRETPVIFLTARGDTASMVAAFQAGGVDYVIKPFQIEEVLIRVRTHLRLSRLTLELREKNHVLEQRTAELMAEMERRRQAETALRSADQTLAAFADLEASRSNLAGLIGQSPHVRRILEDIRRLHAFPQTSVLITGPSGTGKELVARALHFESSRARAPFVPVNCSAIPAELAESTFFGHVRGSFTGATADRKGCFELAHGGTLFLDEIGDMPMALQAKLLRVLEEGFVTPVGATQPRRVDARIIAATNADLESRIAAGTFRQDLYFRIARFTMATPPLRDRREDIRQLAQHFLGLFAAEFGIRAPSLLPESLAALQAHDYPGNVRELRNLIERALIRSGGQPIEPGHLGLIAPVLLMPAVSALSILPEAPPSGVVATVKAQPSPDETTKDERSAFVQTLPLNLAEAEELLIQRALHETHGNIADAARRLGVHRSRIYRKLAQESGGPGVRSDSPEPSEPADLREPGAAPVAPGNP